MDTASMKDRRRAADSYNFRGLHPSVRFGTASDRYAGWIGQIYPENVYASQISSRTKKLGGTSFEERQVPVASVKNYFEHFGTLELDFTFYRPLLEPDGDAGTNYHVLSRYAEHAPPDASFVLKAPQTYFARKLRRSGSYVQNEQFLDAEAYTERFHEPALDLLGDRLEGILFEQEYQRVSDSPEADENIEQLDGFFSEIPGEVQPHLELRSKHLLTEGYFEWLEERGLGFVFSHWTWLPRIKKQWEMCGGRFTAANDGVIARLLTPRNMKYAEAYSKTHPFDEPVSELTESRQGQEMVLDTAALAFQAAAQNATLSVFANNRAWGNAPDLARAIAHRILDEEERRAEENASGEGPAPSR